jgi:hypothetical protein
VTRFRVKYTTVRPILAITFYALLIGLFVRYSLTLGTVRLNDDAATYYVLAQEMLLAKALIPQDWVYVNGDLMLWGRPFINASLILIGVDGYTSHVVATILLLLAAVVIVFLTLRLLRVGTNSAILIAALPIIPYSNTYMVHAATISSYMVRFIHISLLVLMILWIVRMKHTGWKLVAALSLFALATVGVVYENPNRYVIYLLAPAVAASVFCLFSRMGGASAANGRTIVFLLKNISINVWLVSLVGFLAFAVAVVMYRVIEFQNTDWASGAILHSLSELMVRAAVTLKGLSDLSGLNWAEGAKVNSIAGTLSILRIFLYPMALALPAIYLWRLRESLAIDVFFYGAFALAGLVLTFFLLSATTLQAEGSRGIHMTIRYVLPFFLMLLITNGLLWRYYHPVGQVILSIALLVLCFSSLQLASSWKPQYEHDRRHALVEELKRRNLSTAFAPYWSSHIYTLLSSNEVKVRPIQNFGKIEPFSGLNSKRWYMDNDKPLVFLIPDKELESYVQRLKASCYPPPSERFKVSGYTVLIFPRIERSRPGAPPGTLPLFAGSESTTTTPTKQGCR